MITSIHRSRLSIVFFSLVSLSPFAAQAQTLLAGEQAVSISAIEGVVAEGANWNLAWADFVTADGIVGTDDGGVLFAQEQTDKIIKLTVEGEQYTYLENTNGGGAVSLDNDGRLFGVQRTCTEPLNDELAGCNELTTVAMLLPEYHLLANSFADGSSLGRVNDLITDGKGGAYFTSRGAWYVNAEGEISVVADEDIFSNDMNAIDWADAIHPSDKNKARKAYQKYQKDGKEYNLQYRIVRPDGNIRTIKNRAYPVLDETGHMIRMAGIAQDITGKQARI